MNPRFRQNLKVVAAVHLGVLLLLAAASTIRSMFRPKREFTVPVEFVVEAARPAPVPDSAEFFDIPEEPEPPPPVPPPPPAPEPRPKRKEIKVSRNRVRRSSEPPPPPRKTLSEERIRELLAAGAAPGDHTAVPENDARFFEIVRRAMYAAWAQPSREEVGDAVAEIALALDPDGSVSNQRLVAASGNEALDVSVLAAARSVARIPGLSHDFLRRHPVITISFKVE